MRLNYFHSNKFTIVLTFRVYFQVPYQLLESIFCNGSDAIQNKLASNLVLIQHQILKVYAETLPSNGAVSDEFSEQH